MRCDIIIPIWNQLEVTKDCIEHLIANTAYPYRLILVDNASADETRLYLAGLKARRGADVVVMRNEENLGFVKAVNQALRISDAPYVCVLNNDTIPAPGWLERMVVFAEEHDDVGLINPQCGGHGASTVEEHARRLAQDKGLYMEMNQCQGFCMLIKRPLIDAIGLLDEAFGIGGFDDTDYSMRAHRAGYRCVAIRDAYVYHRLHTSFDEAGNRESWVARNRKIYYEKWGKHFRVGVALSRRTLSPADLAPIVDCVYELARNWSWVHLWINTNVKKHDLDAMIEAVMREKSLPPHQNIRIDHFDLPAWLFTLTVAGKCIERLRSRMKDKRFDALVIVDEALGKTAIVAARMLKASLVTFSTAHGTGDWQTRAHEVTQHLNDKKREYA